MGTRRGPVQILAAIDWHDCQRTGLVAATRGAGQPCEGDSRGTAVGANRPVAAQSDQFDPAWPVAATGVVVGTRFGGRRRSIGRCWTRDRGDSGTKPDHSNFQQRMTKRALFYTTSVNLSSSRFPRWFRGAFFGHLAAIFRLLKRRPVRCSHALTGRSFAARLEQSVARPPSTALPPNPTFTGMRDGRGPSATGETTTWKPALSPPFRPPPRRPVERPRTVDRVVRGIATSDGAGVKLTRVLTQNLQRRLDPFLMPDAFGTDNKDDHIGGFPRSPAPGLRDHHLHAGWPHASPRQRRQ